MVICNGAGVRRDVWQRRSVSTLFCYSVCTLVRDRHFGFGGSYSLTAKRGRARFRSDGVVQRLIFLYIPHKSLIEIEKRAFR